MFVRKSEFEELKRDYKFEIERAREGYWELKRLFNLVISDLGLAQEDIHAHTILVRKEKKQ
jgi:uncharacterized protein YjiS (DUF1127 family)